MKTKYHYTKQVVDVEVYFTEKDGKIVNIHSTDYAKFSEEEKKNISVEKISVLKPCWALSTKVERMSVNPITQNLDNILFLKNQILYYLKSCSMVELKLEKDVEGDERIKNMVDILGENGLDSQVISALTASMYTVLI